MKILKLFASGSLDPEKEMQLTSWVLRIAILLCLLVLNVCYLAAQTGTRSARAGIAVGTSCSGNGHGTFYTPGLVLGYGRHQLELSAMVHKRSGLTRGGRMYWSYNLTAPRYDSFNYERIGLRLISYAQYNDPLPLSYGTVREEQMIRRNEQVDWNSVSLSTAEVGSGVQLSIGLGRHVSWRNYIAAAAYHHLNYSNWMNHPECAVVLSMGSSLKFTF
jgi:hypothetical protein